MWDLMIKQQIVLIIISSSSSLTVRLLKSADIISLYQSRCFFIHA